MHSVPDTKYQPPVWNFDENGYVDNDRGWYDLDGCGKPHNYCRWRGNIAGSNPNGVRIAGSNLTCL